MTVSLKIPKQWVLLASWASTNNMAVKAKAVMLRAQSYQVLSSPDLPLILWEVEMPTNLQGLTLHMGCTFTGIDHLCPINFSGVTSIWISCRSTPGIYRETLQVGAIHLDYPIKRMQPVFQIHRNLTNLVALISPSCIFHHDIKIRYTQMQWNACKSSEIKNPFGCRDVFIIKTLTSWIWRNAIHCWGRQGSQRGAVSFIASSHGAEEENNIRKNKFSGTASLSVDQTQFGDEMSPVVSVISLQRFGSSFTCIAPGTTFLSETFSCEAHACAHYFIVTSLQILLSYAPFFSTRYVKVQLLRLKVGVAQCVFRTSSLGFVSWFRVGFEWTKTCKGTSEDS